MELKLDDKLLKKIKDTRKKHRDTRGYRPILYMLAKNEKGVINRMYKIPLDSFGCDEMRRAKEGSLHKTYNKIIKAKHIPCGYISFVKGLVYFRSFRHKFARNEIFLCVNTYTGEVRSYKPVRTKDDTQHEFLL